MNRFRLPYGFLALSWIFLIADAGLAWGNLAASSAMGESVGEPVGSLEKIHIRSENLAFDFRPVAQKDKRYALIRATYHIEQKGPVDRVSLFFVAPGLKEGTISFDGKPLRGRKETRPMPKAWQAHGGVKKSEGLLFEVTIPLGKHTISVAYRARCDWEGRAGYVQAYGVRYILGPAKQWGSFGTLHISATFPSSWGAWRNSLSLMQKGDQLKGTFQGIPADVMVLFTAPPAGWLVLREPALIGVLLFGCLLALWIGWRGRRWVLAEGCSTGKQWLRGVGLVLAAIALQIAVAWGGVFGIRSLATLHPYASHNGYELLVWLALGTVVLPFVSVCVLALGLLILRRKLQPRQWTM